MHCTYGMYNRMSNQWKWPINNKEIWYEKVVQKIAPPEPIHSGLVESLRNLNFRTK